MKIDGDVFLTNGFKAEGEVRLAGAIIGGDLSFEPDAQLSNPNGNALFADRVKIDGGLFLRTGFKSEGEVRFSGATMATSFCVMASSLMAKCTSWERQLAETWNAMVLSFPILMAGLSMLMGQRSMAAFF